MAGRSRSWRDRSSRSCSRSPARPPVAAAAAACWAAARRRRPPRVPLRPRGLPCARTCSSSAPIPGTAALGRPATVASGDKHGTNRPEFLAGSPAPWASDAHLATTRRGLTTEGGPRRLRPPAGASRTRTEQRRNDLLRAFGRSRAWSRSSIVFAWPSVRAHRAEGRVDPRIPTVTAQRQAGTGSSASPRASAADHDGPRPEQRSASGGPSSSHSTAGRAPCQRSATLSTPRRRGRGMPRSTGRATGQERCREQVDGAGALDGDPPERPGQVREVVLRHSGCGVDIGPPRPCRSDVRDATTVVDAAEDLARRHQPRVDRPRHRSGSPPGRAHKKVGGGDVVHPRFDGGAQPAELRHGYEERHRLVGLRRRWTVEQESGAKRGEGNRRRLGQAEVRTGLGLAQPSRTTWSRNGRPDGSAPGPRPSKASAANVVERWPTGRTRASGGASPP